MKLQRVDHAGRKESTGKKAGMEFTKPEDPEQRAADPWIKKMQEIRRQEGEKWAGYKRNENGELALDNVEETARASELTNDESITVKTQRNCSARGNVKLTCAYFRHCCTLTGNVIK